MLYVTNAKILTPNGFVENVGMTVDDGKITAFTPKCPENAEVLDCGGKLVIPGFIDIHLHGGGGFDFMDGSLEAFEEISKAHCLHGTTSMCPTTVSCPLETMFAFFDLYEEAKSKGRYSDFIGVHLEGPFISMEFKGAHNPNYIITPDSETLLKVLERGKGIITRISLAPELEHMDTAIPMIKSKGISVALAHSNTDCEGTLEAYAKGVDLITHLYCTTPSVRKINQKVHAGIIEAFYLADGMRAELIGDGCHVPKQVIRLVHKLKGADKMCLITDAMRAAGTDVTESYLGAIIPENRVIIEDGVAKLPDRSFYAGSIATMDRVFKNAVCNALLPVEEVSKIMSATPAKLAGVDKYKGILEVGYDADFLVIDGNMDVESVFVRGDRKK